MMSIYQVSRLRINPGRQEELLAHQDAIKEINQRFGLNPAPTRLDVDRHLRQKGGSPIKEVISLPEEITDHGMFAMVPMESGKIIKIHHEGIVWHGDDPTNE